VTAGAEEAWMALLRSGQRVLGTADCTPGYYNNEGHPERGDVDAWRGYPEGPVAFFTYLEGWLSAGDFEGLAFD
jgi:hypothetical protein